MKKITSLLLAFAMLLGSLLALTSCGEPKDDGAEISVYLGEKVYDFDPTDYYVDSNAEQVMSLLYDPLFSVNEKGKLKCDGAAKKYKVDEEERTIVIELKETYWSDLIRVKAEDYVYAWRNVLLNPNNANPAAALLYDIENALEVKLGEKTIYELGVSATDTYELTITYREGADYKQLLKNLASVATAPIRQDIATNIASGYWSKIANTAVTNGPFIIKSVDNVNNSFTIGRNEGYHQDPTIKNTTKIVRPSILVSLTARGEGETALSYADLLEKTVFYMGDASLEDRKEYKKKATVSDDLSTYTYVFNLENELFAIKKVRQALSMAIDREAIIEAITFGKAATGFLPDSVLSSAKGKSFNKKVDDLISTSEAIADAKALLSSVDLTGIDRSFELTVNDDEESLAIASIVKTAWESLDAGLSVKIKAVGTISTAISPDVSSEPIEDSEIQVLVNNAARGDRDFDVIAVDWQMYSTDAFVALASFSSYMNGNGAQHGVPRLNVSGWWSADYDHHLDTAYKADSAKDKKEALKSAEEILLDSCAVIPVVYNQSFAFVSKDVSKVSYDAFGNFSLKKAVQKNYHKYLNSEE